jgi:beta-mannosidase
MSSSASALGPWELLSDDGVSVPVVVPGTVTQAYPGATDADSRTWVFRTAVATVPDGPVDLVLEGVATSFEVLLDDVVLATGRSMFARTCVDVTGIAQVGSVLEIRCLPLATALPEGKPPRARWRTKLVEDSSLRLIRTMLLGRCPGIAPGPPAVGPYRAVRLVSRPVPLSLRTRLDGTTGVLTVSGPGEFHCAGISGPAGDLLLPDVERWWPHTHGAPVLHEVTRTLDGATSVVGKVGFRSVVNADPTSLDLVVNDVPVWVRGAVWTPPGLLAGLPEDPVETVRLARDAGLNLLRVPGTGAYESAEFFAACDELGVMVWHDLALANLDVPHDLLPMAQEVTDLLDRAGPSLVVVCGGSETAQQVAMLGLDPTLWASHFLSTEAPALVGDRALWIGNSPVGGALPFRVGSGVAHYFGVGGYRRPLSDVRLSSVRFASECLAFSIPSADGSGWVPQDNGSPWHFGEVTAHYADLLDRPATTIVGEVMDQVFGEWRRAASPNRGGVLLWLRDLQPGAGWGIVTSTGSPKEPWWYLRRSLAPQAIWLTDEGLDGVAVHLANDRPSSWEGSLRIAVYRADDLRLEEVLVPLAVPAHGSWTGDVEGLLGRFLDLSYAFRFGGPTVTSVVATFEDGSAAPQQAFHFPVGRPPDLHPAEVLTLVRDGGGLTLASSRLLDTVRLSGHPSDNHFCLEPDRPRRLEVPDGPVTVTGLNLGGSVTA